MEDVDEADPEVSFLPVGEITNKGVVGSSPSVGNPTDSKAWMQLLEKYNVVGSSSPPVGNPTGLETRVQVLKKYNVVDSSSPSIGNPTGLKTWVQTLKNLRNLFEKVSASAFHKLYLLKYYEIEVTYLEDRMDNAVSAMQWDELAEIENSLQRVDSKARSDLAECEPHTWQPQTDQLKGK